MAGHLKVESEPSWLATSSATNSNPASVGSDGCSRRDEAPLRTLLLAVDIPIRRAASGRDPHCPLSAGLRPSAARGCADGVHWEYRSIDFWAPKSRRTTSTCSFAVLTRCGRPDRSNSGHHRRCGERLKSTLMRESRHQTRGARSSASSKNARALHAWRSQRCSRYDLARFGYWQRHVSCIETGMLNLQ
jgi:hypothetical protein